MASTYSDLKIELIGTGDQTGTWGGTTNNNLSVAVSEAITGSADVPFSSADVTVTLTDTNAAQTARNLRLNLTGTSGGARNLILGSGCQIEKLYLINNGLADAVTVKNTSGTGIVVPAGKSMFVFNNGTNVVDATTYLSSLTLGTALPIASGGTGTTSTTFVNLASNVTGTLPVANGGTGITSLGSGVATWLGTPSSANLASAVTDETGTGALVFANTPTLVTPVLGTPTSGALTNCTADGTNAVGSRNIPQSGAGKTTSYTLATTDVGDFILLSTGSSVIIPNSTFAAGDAISMFNNTTGNITITCSTTLTYIGGTDSDKATVALATRGVATVLFIDGTTAVITGNVS
jgi:hypothetical protein